MKIAAFNVENLFERARAFNVPDEDFTKQILSAVAEINSLFQKKTYSAADKARMVELLMFLDMERSDTGDFAMLRRNKGSVVKRPQGGPPQIVADGRDEWIGWVELRNDPVNQVAVMNTGRVIAEVDADVLAVVEAENRVSLKRFSEVILREVGGSAYDEVMVIDGNDDRGIDVGLMTRRNHHIGWMRSHIHDPVDSKNKTFSRDCPEFAIMTPTNELIWVLPNHFKSKFGGDNAASKKRREAQATRVAEIYNQLVARGEDNIVVLGDLNDTPNSAPLAPLLAQTDLREVSDHPTFDSGQFAGKGTYGLGNNNQKIDYLLFSPALWHRVTACGLFRKGAWPGTRPKRWDVFDELERDFHAASDHHLIWATIG